MLLNKLAQYQVILASNSPRRKQLMEGAGIDFSVITNGDVDESYPADMPLNEVPVYLAKLKSHAFRPLAGNEILITADTVVLCNKQLLGKPEDENDATRMLRMLSGNSHEVLTGVCIRTQNLLHTFATSSLVDFRPLSSEEILYYVEHYKPYDKAGAYGAQEWIGYIGIQRIEGSYFNVMGLPIQQLFVELDRLL